MKINKILKNLMDEDYAEFTAKLIPGIPRENIIGIRIPVLRKIAAEYIKDEESILFMKSLPHQYHDENILHSILISVEKDFNKCLELTEEFLPYIDNWAVCDSLSPKIFKKNREKLLVKIKEWISSEKTYVRRFGMGMLMAHFLDEDFNKEYLELPASVISDEYYVNMMTAWFFATALTKQWDFTKDYLEEKRLSVWVHNKTIQKAMESFKIPPDRKEYLKSLKIKVKK